MSSAPIGVLPNHAIWWSAITRPCIAGSVACWRTTVFDGLERGGGEPERRSLTATNGQKPGVTDSAMQRRGEAGEDDRERPAWMRPDTGDVDATERSTRSR